MQTLLPSNKTILDSADALSESYSDKNESDKLATSANASLERNKKWEILMDHTLIKWGQCNADPFDEEGLERPTLKAIRKAYEVASNMQKQGWPLPTGVIPDGEGGVVFENRNEPSYQRLEIEPDGLMSLVVFSNCAFQSRVLVELESQGR